MSVSRIDELEDEVQPAATTQGSLLRYALSAVAFLGGLGALELARGRFQRSQVFLPSKYPTGIWDPSIYGVPYEDVWFESEDRTSLHGWWIPHARATATLIYCHGNSGSIADRIGIYRQLRRLKLNIFTFDYRGFGRSSGQPSESGLFADARAAYDLLLGRPEIDPAKVLVFGHSLGGAVAIDLAVHRPAAGLVVQSSFTNLRAMAREMYPTAPIHWLTRNEFRSIEKVGRLEMPKLFIHGSEDGTVPYRMGEELFAEAAEPKTWLPVPNAGHNDVHRHRPFRYFRTISKFRKRCTARR